MLSIILLQCVVHLSGPLVCSACVSLSSWRWLGWADTPSVRLEMRGRLPRLARSVPGSAGAAGWEPSMLRSSSAELARVSGFLDRLELTVFWMEGPSVGRLASW